MGSKDGKGATEFFTLPSRRGVGRGGQEPPDPVPEQRPDSVSGRGLGALPGSGSPAAPAAPPPVSRRPAVTWSAGPIDDSERASSMRGMAILAAFGSVVVGVFGVVLAVSVAMLIYAVRPEWLGLDSDDPYAARGGLMGETGMGLDDEDTEVAARTGGGGAVAAGPEEDPNAPAPIVITMVGPHPFLEYEVECPGGFRNRASLKKGAGTVFGVPVARCKVEFNGGPAASTYASGGDSLRCSWDGSLRCSAP